MAPARIPSTVITGFLGAGKTTLIRNIIMQANGKRLALIVNEFGDIGMDGDMLQECGAESCSAEDIIELANGCICCNVADDFRRASSSFWRRNRSLTTSLSKHPDSPCRNRSSRPSTGPTLNRR